MDGCRASVVLGVDTDASPQEVRRAFHLRAAATHPDHGGDLASYELVVLAFEALQQIAALERILEPA
jgi:curved DNA-binding protein CbpA